MPSKPASPCTMCGQPAIDRGRCQKHKRGTTTQRGYNQTHKNTRADWEPIVATGHINCWRCYQPINPAEPWDLGHDDNNRNIYRGPEHTRCNRAAAAKARNR